MLERRAVGCPKPIRVRVVRPGFEDVTHLPFGADRPLQQLSTDPRRLRQFGRLHCKVAATEGGEDDRLEEGRTRSLVRDRGF
jgi:hypothetical protein